MRSTKNKIILFSFIIIIATIFADGFAFAQSAPPAAAPAPIKPGDLIEIKTAEELGIDFKQPRLRVNIPTITFGKVLFKTYSDPSVTGGQKTFINIPYLCDYIVGAYKFAIGVGIILAVIIIIHNGLKWSVSGGNVATITSAKEGITNAIFGLLILLGAVVILTIINPDLSVCNSLQINKLNIASGLSTNLSFLGGKGLVSPATEAILLQSSLTKEAADKLGGALALMKLLREKNISAALECKEPHFGAEGTYREADKQFEIWLRNCVTKEGPNARCEGPKGEKAACRPKCFQEIEPPAAILNDEQLAALKKQYSDKFNACQPSTKGDGCPHTARIAVDLFCENTSDDGLKESVNGANDPSIPASQSLLIMAMLNNDFCVLLGPTNVQNKVAEAWHFEYFPRKLSPACTISCLDLKQHDFIKYINNSSLFPELRPLMAKCFGPELANEQIEQGGGGARRPRD